MKELQEVRNEVLHLKNIGVLHKKEETKLLNKLNALEIAINYTGCCGDVVCGNCDGYGYTVDEDGRRKDQCKECR